MSPGVAEVFLTWLRSFIALSCSYLRISWNNSLSIQLSIFTLSSAALAARSAVISGSSPCAKAVITISAMLTSPSRAPRTS